MKSVSLSFLENSNAKTFLSPGEIGEIVCRFLFLLAIIRTRCTFPPQFQEPININTFRDITSIFYPKQVKAFLNQFIEGDMIDIYLKLCDAFYCKTSNSAVRNVFSDSLIAFAYFHRCDNVSDPVDFTRAMLYRGCARILSHNHPGADFILPLVTGDDQLGNILVQVKFVANSYLYETYNNKTTEDRIRLMNDLLNAFNAIEALDSRKLAQIISKSRDNTKSFFKTAISNFHLGRIYGNTADKKPFPHLRIFINIREDAKNISAIELDKFGPILIIETNGRPEATPDFLRGCERLMIQNIINKGRSEITIQELKGQSSRPAEPRILDSDSLPINPIYYNDLIDGDNEKISMPYFENYRNELSLELANRPKFQQKFQHLLDLLANLNRPKSQMNPKN